MQLLDALGHASSKAEGGEKESRTRLGWEKLPSAAPAYEPLPRGHDVYRGLRLRDGGFAGDREGDRAPLRRSWSHTGRDRLHALRRGSRGDRRGARGTRSEADPDPREHLLGSRAGGGRAAGGARRARPQRRDRSDQAPARDRGQALGLDAQRKHARPARPDPRRRAADAARRVDHRHLEPGCAASARELHAGRHIEGRARGTDPLPRRGARAARDPRQRRLGWGRRHRRARPLPEPQGDAPHGEEEPGGAPGQA